MFAFPTSSRSWRQTGIIFLASLLITTSTVKAICWPWSWLGNLLPRAHVTETKNDAEARQLWNNIVAKINRRRKDNLKLVGAPTPVMERLPEGIPSELQPAFEELNRIMGDNVPMVKWLISLELEIKNHLESQFQDEASLKDKTNILAAIQFVIGEHAKKAGWPPEVYVYGDEGPWRNMIGQGHLFIDRKFENASRSNPSKNYSHTAGAHLLQLLYASETLNASAALKDAPVFQQRGVMPTLMTFMGDKYLIKTRIGETPFLTNDSLRWISGSNPYKENSLWFNLFDGRDNDRKINSPENFGKIYHELPLLKEIEDWAKEPINFP